MLPPFAPVPCGGGRSGPAHTFMCPVFRRKIVRGTSPPAVAVSLSPALSAEATTAGGVFSRVAASSVHRALCDTVHSQCLHFCVDGCAAVCGVALPAAEAARLFPRLMLAPPPLQSRVVLMSHVVDVAVRVRVRVRVWVWVWVWVCCTPLTRVSVVCCVLFHLRNTPARRRDRCEVPLHALTHTHTHTHT